MVGSCAVGVSFESFPHHHFLTVHTKELPSRLTPPHCSNESEVYQRGCQQHLLPSSNLTTCISGVYLFVGCLPNRIKIPTLGLGDSSGFMWSFDCLPQSATFDLRMGQLTETNQRPSSLAHQRPVLVVSRQWGYRGRSALCSSLRDAVGREQR